MAAWAGRGNSCGCSVTVSYEDLSELRTFVLCAINVLSDVTRNVLLWLSFHMAKLRPEASKTLTVG